MKKQPVPGGRERLRKNPHQFSIIPSNEKTPSKTNPYKNKIEAI